MDPILKSSLLFIGLCIPTRLLLVHLSKEHTQLLPYMSFVSFLIAIGFATIFMFNLRKTGLETFGEPIWWNNLRPVHASLYLLFSYMALYHPENAWYPLALDVCIGILAFTVKRTGCCYY